MASPRIEYAVLPAGDGPGQDRCFTTDGLVVVLDGASAYDPSVSPDAGKYVNTLGPALIDQITSKPGIDLGEALGEAIRSTADKLALTPGRGPSSTVSITRWCDYTIDVLVLGDSPVVVQFTDGSEQTIVQHPQDHIAHDLRRLYRDRLREGCGYDSRHRELLAEIQREEGTLRNVHGGCWIAEAEPRAAKAAQQQSFPTNRISRILMASDGVANHAQWLRDATSSPPVDLLRKLHAFEEFEDPNGVAIPRSKRHDDKTLVVISQ